MGNPEPAVWPRIVDSNVKVVNAYDNSVDNLERMDMVNASMSTLPHSLISRRGRRWGRFAISASMNFKSRPPNVSTSRAKGTYSIFRREGCCLGRGGTGAVVGACDELGVPEDMGPTELRSAPDVTPD